MGADEARFEQTGKVMNEIEYRSIQNKNCVEWAHDCHKQGYIR